MGNIKSNKAFTLIEILAAIGILVTFLAAAIVAFTASQNASDNNQQQASALQAAKAKLEEMRASDFSSLEATYGDGGAGTGISFATGGLEGMGNIVIKDLYGGIWTEATDMTPWYGETGRTYFDPVAFDDGSGAKMYVIGGYYNLYFGYSYVSDIWASTDGINWAYEGMGPQGWYSGYDTYYSTGLRGMCTTVYDDGTGPAIWCQGGYDCFNLYAGIYKSFISEGDGLTYFTYVGDAPLAGEYNTLVSSDDKIWITDDEVTWYSSADGIDWVAGGAPSTMPSTIGLEFKSKYWNLGNGSSILWTYGAGRMYQVDIVVSWRNRSDRIVGEDNGGSSGRASAYALNGILDTSQGEGTAAYGGDDDAELDSPVHVTGIIADPDYPSRVYMGKE